MACGAVSDCQCDREGVIALQSTLGELTRRRTVHPWVEFGRIESTTNELGQTRKISDPASLPTPCRRAAVRTSAFIGGDSETPPRRWLMES